MQLTVYSPNILRFAAKQRNYRHYTPIKKFVILAIWRERKLIQDIVLDNEVIKL